MIVLSQILELLAHMESNPQLYIDPVTPEAMYGYFSGLHRGVVAASSTLTLSDFFDAHRHSMHKLGIAPAAGPVYAVKKLRLSNAESTNTVVKLEIETWKLLAEWHKVDGSV